MTYDNPVYIEQKKRKHETIDDSGFTVPKKLDELDDDDIENDDKLAQEPSDSFRDDDWDDDWDDDDDEFEEVVDKPIMFTKEPTTVPSDDKKGLSAFMDEFENKEKANNDDMADFINSFGSTQSEPTTMDNNSVNVNIPSINPTDDSVVENPQPVKKVIKFKL